MAIEIHDHWNCTPGELARRLIYMAAPPMREEDSYSEHLARQSGYHGAVNNALQMLASLTTVDKPATTPSTPHGGAGHDKQEASKRD